MKTKRLITTILTVVLILGIQTPVVADAFTQADYPTSWTFLDGRTVQVEFRDDGSFGHWGGANGNVWNQLVAANMIHLPNSFNGGQVTEVAILNGRVPDPNATTSESGASVAPVSPTVPVSPRAYGEILIRINGEFVHISYGDQVPIIVDSRTLVPLRVVMEALGFNVHWDPYPINQASLTSATIEGLQILVTIGRETMRVYDLVPGERFGYEDVPLDVPAQIINNRTMVPVRAISEATGFMVEWDNDNRIVDVWTTAGNAPPQQTLPQADLSALEQAVRNGTGILTIYRQFPEVAVQEIQTAFEQEVIRLVNEIRAGYGLTPARVFHPEVARIARLRTDEIIEHNSDSTLGHVSPVDGTLAGSEFARARGLNVTGAAENAAWGATSPQMVVDGWMNSPGHRNFMLYTDFNFIGVGFSFAITEDDSGRARTRTAWTLWLTT